MASDPDKLKRTAVARANDAATAALRAEIDKKASLINSHHEETVFDADRHVKDATEQYYEEISLEGDHGWLGIYTAHSLLPPLLPPPPAVSTPPDSASVPRLAAPPLFRNATIPGAP